MGIQPQHFCENCGAANAKDTLYCTFCGRPMQDEPALVSVALSSDRALPANTLLKGRYRIISPVAEGGMGRVYRAQDTQLSNRLVAVKETILNDQATRAGKEVAESFQHESLLLAGLQHPGLPTIFEYFAENQRWYLVMSFVQGETLEKHLERQKDGKLPVREVLQIGLHLCEIIQYLHNQYPPIIFRDLKPANIILKPDGELCLIDFGVARRWKTGQKKDTIPFGSLGYASPEQFGKAQTTPRSDIYSLGVLLHQMLSGHDPTITPRKQPNLRSLEPKTPFDLYSLISKMLDKQEHKRPSNIIVVQQKLQTLKESLYPLASALSVNSKKAASSRRSLRTARATGSVVLALICLMAGGWINSQTSQQSSAASLASSATAIANAVATETQIKALPDPYQPQGTLALVDPLNQEDYWGANSNPDWGGTCQYNQEALQVSQTKPGRLELCDGSIAFANFALQVQMTITEGDCGGVSFRGSADGLRSYKFQVCADGTYNLYKYTSYSDNTSLNQQSSNPAIEKGATTNIVAVVANGNTIDLYLNKQKIETIFDSSYESGEVSLMASDNEETTTVRYQNMMIWSLPA